MFRKIVQLTLIFTLMLFFTISLQAQTKIENIKEDIRIMESILEQLLESSRNYSFNGRNIKGFYFDDYGLLFNVNMENNFNVFSLSTGVNILNEKILEVEEKSKSKDENRKGVVVSPSRANLYKPFGLGIDEADFEEWEKRLDKKVKTFMTTYVDNGNFLRNNDKVSVVAFFGSRSSDSPRAKVYQVTKSVIGDVLRDKISETDFEKRLTKQLISGDNNNENIDIMSNIIKSSLEGKKKSQYLWGGNVQGIFLKELGVMFSFGDRYFRDIFSDDFHIWTFPEGNVKAEVFIENSMKKKAESSKKFRENLSNFEEDIIKVIGQYGAASLKFLPENQSVFVLFGTKGYSDKDISNVMIRLRKSDLIDFSRDRLNLENLRKRAQIVEY